MARWVCTVCQYIYDEAMGEPSNDTPAGTAFEDLPDDWLCPVCAAAKDAFVQEEDADAALGIAGMQ